MRGFFLFCFVLFFFFGIIVRSTLSALILFPKIMFILLLLEIWQFVYKTISGFSGSVILRNQPLKFPIPTVLDLIGCRKCRIFLWENVWKFLRNYGSNRKHCHLKQKSQNWQLSYFSPLGYANFNYPYLEIGLSNLFRDAGVLHKCVRRFFFFLRERNVEWQIRQLDFLWIFKFWIHL